VLYEYEIVSDFNADNGIMRNFKFGFCNCRSLFVMWCYVRTIISKCKTVSGRPKTVRTVDACMLLRMLSVVCDAFNVLKCSLGFFSRSLPVLSFVADPVTVHAHEYVCISILLSLTSTVSVNLQSLHPTSSHTSLHYFYVSLKILYNLYRKV